MAFNNSVDLGLLDLSDLLSFLTYLYLESCAKDF